MSFLINLGLDLDIDKYRKRTTKENGLKMRDFIIMEINMNEVRQFAWERK